MGDAKEQSYLKQNVLMEPLINQWYAWTYLIPPVTAGMFIANSHVKIMQSFIANPQVHVSALKNPAMLGGPFINYDPTRTGEVRQLLDKTLKEQATELRLAEAVKTLNEMLLNEATGYSLEPLYQKIPDMLKGFVELVYDLNNYPSIRFIERLLYRSSYYKESSQAVSLSLINGDDRSFVFSTPRLKESSRLHIDIPFRSPELDELFKMKNEPRPRGYVKEVLSVKDEDDATFASLFTTETPQPPPKFTGDGIRVRYFGHACLLIESNSTAIMLDPVISYKVGGEIARYTYADLPEKIDYALITHNHQDHCMFESLLQLRHKFRNLIVPSNNNGALADPSLKLILEQTGFKNVLALDDMESVSFGDGTITGLPFFGEHADLNIRTKTAYLINMRGTSILCVADSNNFLEGIYDRVHEIVGDVDLVFLGMECEGAPLTWLYGPLLTRPLARKMDQSRRFDGSNYEKALDLVNVFKPKEVYIYAMGQEPWLTYLTSIQYTESSRPIIDSNKLVEACRARNITSERLFGCKEMIYPQR